jgi:hypothetical protein
VNLKKRSSALSALPVTREGTLVGDDMARYVLTSQDRSKGGKSQPRDAKVEAGKKGWETTMERHPWMFSYLKHAPGMRHFKQGKFDPKKEAQQ